MTMRCQNTSQQREFDFQDQLEYISEGANWAVEETKIMSHEDCLAYRKDSGGSRSLSLIKRAICVVSRSEKKRQILFQWSEMPRDDPGYIAV